MHKEFKKKCIPGKPKAWFLFCVEPCSDCYLPIQFSSLLKWKHIAQSFSNLSASIVWNHHRNKFDLTNKPFIIMNSSMLHPIQPWGQYFACWPLADPLRRHNQPSKTGGRPIFRTTQPVFWTGFDPLSDILQRPPCSRACLDILPVFAVSLPTIIYSNLNKGLQISGDPSAPQPLSGGQWTVNQKLEGCEHSPVVHWWPAIWLSALMEVGSLYLNKLT